MNEYRSRLTAVAWGCALLTTLNGSLHTPQPAPFHEAFLIVTALAAVVVVLFPLSRTIVGVSATAFVGAVATQLPALPNHRLALSLVALLFLLEGIGRRDSRERNFIFSDRFFSTVRVLTLIIYFYACAAKLNTSYLDPAVSCAVQFSNATLEGYAFGGGFLSSRLAGHGVIWWSILTEAALCVFLVWGRTRRWAVLYGVLFHLALGLDYIKYFGNFSTTMYLFLLAWLSEDEARALWRRAEGFWQVVVPGVTYALAFNLLGALSGLIPPLVWFVLREVFFLTYALGLAFNLGAFAFGAVGVPERWVVGGLKGVYGALVLLAVINGLSPYVGLKSRTSFSMYSNLNIDAHSSNHLIMPRNGDIFGLLSDRAAVISTDDSELQRRLDVTKGELPYIALCAYLEGIDDILITTPEPPTVTYQRRGETRSARRFDALPSDCPGFLARRLLFFGPIGEDKGKECVW